MTRSMLAVLAAVLALTSAAVAAVSPPKTSAWGEERAAGGVLRVGVADTRPGAEATKETREESGGPLAATRTARPPTETETEVAETPANSTRNDEGPPTPVTATKTASAAITPAAAAQTKAPLEFPVWATPEPPPKPATPSVAPPRAKSTPETNAAADADRSAVSADANAPKPVVR